MHFSPQQIPLELGWVQGLGGAFLDAVLMGAEPTRQLPPLPLPAARLVQQMLRAMNQGGLLCKASAQWPWVLPGLVCGSAGGSKHRDGVRQLPSISDARPPRQSISCGIAALVLFLTALAKAVCRFIPALGLFHALWLPASPGEGDEYLGVGSRAPTSKKSQPQSWETLSKAQSSGACVLAGNASRD